MPTYRLSYDDKHTLAQCFNKTLSCCLNNSVFPIRDSREFADFAIGLIREPARTHYIELLRLDASLVGAKQRYLNWFLLPAEEGKYKIECRSLIVPRDGLVLNSEHPMYQEILEWARQSHKIRQDAKRARIYAEHAIDVCSTFGQVMRVCPPDFATYLPNNMVASMKNAERASRFPKRLRHQPDEIEHLGRMLALGALSPETTPDDALKVYVDEFVSNPQEE